MDYRLLIPQFIDQGRLWVKEQRAVHRVAGRRLGEGSDILVRFFDPPVLDAARFVHVPRIENPPFFTALAAGGIPIPLDFTEMHGITFIDTVLLSRVKVGDASPVGLVFHELVHMVQYQLLGVDKFMERYVNGWADNGFEYQQIPLERIAYDLQARFEAEPSREFSVFNEVGSRL